MAIAFPILVIFCMAASSVRSAIPPGYILDITPECGPDGIADGVVKLMTDFSAEAKAFCAGGTSVKLTSKDGVNYAVPVSYPGKGGGKSVCKYKKKRDSLVYTVLIIVAFGEPGSRLHQSDEEYTITCTFQPKGKKDSGPLKIVPGVSAPKVIEGNKAPVSVSVVKVYLADVKGTPLTGNIPTGKSVRLMAKTTTPKDLGIQVESCDAMDSKGNRYSLLRAGCGDGMIIDKNAGFVTRDKSSSSPFFKVFTVNGDWTLRFECNFTICAIKCNGPSCSSQKTARRRREPGLVGRLQSYLWGWKTNAFSEPYSLTDNGYAVARTVNVGSSRLARDVLNP
ncbi:vitelline envelope sperm lysin receptor-like [Haliotis rufescens]|uniref:Vitelline envelope zona pellucida domain protein 19 n=1 Tax=Haliotis rufescens TaxID=6454 RepID=D0EL57_HALRU|nr:vitelline envelope sperm lysin receptor-like [Haliotis rufescens]ACX37429.1 vitelline envelope zona pellucida domain protein 19 [Haliotis rufescens]